MTRSGNGGPTPARWSRRTLLRLAARTGGALPVAAVLGCAREGSAATRAATAAPGAASGRGAAAAVVASPTPAAPTATPTPSPTATPSPTPAPTPGPLAIELLPDAVGVGEAMRVRVPLPAGAGEATGTLQFAGRQYAMSRLADGSLWAMVAAPLDREPAEGLPLTVEARTAAGALLGSGDARTAIVPVQRPVEYLYVTAEQGAVLGGDAGPRELAIRQSQFGEFDAAAPRWSGLFVRPTGGEISTAFGQARSINDGPIGPGHTGTDFADGEGTPVRLAAAGRVVWAGPMPIRGNSVLVDHGGGVKSGYHHLSAIEVAVGEAVLPAGTVLGAVGSTGFATGPHLHWEVTVWGMNVDGLTWLAVPFSA